MANIPGPLRDYTLGIPGSRVHMAGTVASSVLLDTVDVPLISPGNNIPAPELSNYGTGGGGGPVTYSSPITG